MYTDQNFKLLEEIIIDDIINSKHVYFHLLLDWPRSVFSIEINLYVVKLNLNFWTLASFQGSVYI